MSNTEGLSRKNFKKKFRTKTSYFCFKTLFTYVRNISLYICELQPTNIFIFKNLGKIGTTFFL